MSSFGRSCRRSSVDGSLKSILLRSGCCRPRREPVCWLNNNQKSTLHQTALVQYKSTEGPLLEHQYWKSFRENAHVIGSALALFAATYYAGGTYVSLKKDVELARAQAEKVVELARAQAEKDVELTRAQAEKDVELTGAQAEKEIIEAKREIAERFLMYGYAEEFQRYKSAETYQSRRKE